MDAKIVENDMKQSRKAGVKDNENTADNIGVILKQEEEEQTSSCQQISPKSRRKITKPKHYKPTDSEEDDIEHTGFSRTSEDLNGSASSPESVIQDQGDDVIPENAVHVMTSQAMGSSPQGKRSVNSQKPKRPAANKSAGKKRKHEAPTVPRKPEDLIKEAMILGQPTPPASKRDAQYRKSYAYKIWKERGNQEVRSENTQERNGINGSNSKLPPGPLQNQARAAFYWPGNQYNGTSPPGFFANGKYYAINPQMIPTVHGTPQLSPSSPTIPQFGKASATAATSPRAAPSSVIQSSTAGVVSPGHQRRQFRLPERSSDIANPKRNMAKVIPPNVTVVPQYPQQESISPGVPKPTPKSPVIRTPPLSKTPGDTKTVSPVPDPEIASQTQSPNFENAENGFPDKTSEAVESKATNVSASPSNLVSIMKTSLRQKHSKENVQPLPNMFKSKRKLETDKPDGPAPKKTKPTIFTPLNEQEAEKLANDIYDVNLEYFPFQTLAEKAAQSEETLPETPEKSEKTKRVMEIEKVRCLLKDFYDVTFSCTEDPDMQKFDSASRKFGRKNILNHLSLLDRYFAELQKKLDT